MRTNRLSVILGAALLLLSVTATNAFGQVPGDIGNLDDGPPVDAEGIEEVDESWVPSPTDVLDSQCEALAQDPFVTTKDGIRVIVGVGHWLCSHAYPLNTLEVCLNFVVPSVSCNEKTRPAPSHGMSLAATAPCIPGVWITTAVGWNVRHADADESNPVVILPGDCIQR